MQSATKVKIQNLFSILLFGTIQDTQRGKKKKREENLTIPCYKILFSNLAPSAL
jgi:hypothetical protein